MKKMLLMILTMVLILSCASDDNEVCMVEAYKIPSSQVSLKSTTNDGTLSRSTSNCTGIVTMQDYQNQNVINLDAQGGTLCINGDYNLNSNDTINVENGNLRLFGSGTLSGIINITDGDLILVGSYNLNSGFNSTSNNFNFEGSGVINCGVSITVFEDTDFNGSFTWNCPEDDIVTVDGTVLSTPTFGTREMVPCDYIGREVDGFTYKIVK